MKVVGAVYKGLTVAVPVVTALQLQHTPTVSPRSSPGRPRTLLPPTPVSAAAATPGSNRRSVLVTRGGTLSLSLECKVVCT